MNKNVKKALMYLVAVLVGLLIGFLIFRGTGKTTVIDEDQQEIARLNRKIDTLNTKIGLISLENDSLRKHERVVVKNCTIRIKDIQKLDIDSSSKLLKDNLVKYGMNTKAEDTLPKITEDKKFLLSHDNVKDVNTITEKYKCEIERNNILENVVYNDSVKFLLYEVEIACRDSIQQRSNSIYNKELEKKEDEIKKAKKSARRARVVAILSGAAAIGLGIVNFTH